MKILLGMSGGVDSTYAALKMLKEGHEVTGAVLVMHDCTDTAAAHRAAERLSIPLIEIDCRAAFESEVVAYFLDEYSHGRTPNPCIVCNPQVKFKYLYEYAVAHGFDGIATGHYARILHREDNGDLRYTVARATDSSKDQTYMLYRLPQHILACLHLPLANELKADVKRLANEAGVDEQGQKESQEICFIPDDDYRGFIESRIGKLPEGNFVDGEGRVLGTHRGIVSYTVGQRKGLGVSLGARAFVSRIDPVTNDITLSLTPPNTESITIHSAVYSGITEPPAGESISALVKIRYLARPVHATVTVTGKGRARIDFHEPVGLVAPGQSAVVYGGDAVLLGGFID